MAPIVETFKPAGSPVPIGPHGHIAKVGNHVTIGGLADVNPKTGQIAGGDVYSQAKQILLSFDDMLRTVGSDLDYVMHIHAYLKEMRNFEEMNCAYVDVMGNHRPARTVIGARELPKPQFVVLMNLTAATAGQALRTE